MEYPFGIDISKYQYSSDGKRKPDFDKINQVCDFVAVRAGISWGYIDPWFSYSWENITVPRMAYHVVYPGEDSTKQMDHFLRIVNPGKHDRLVLDLELDHGYPKSVITQTVIECLEYLKSKTGRYPVLYSRALWVNDHLYLYLLPKELDWWLAHYLKRRPSPEFTPEKNPPPMLPKGISQWLIHQTAEKQNGSKVGVVSYFVDTNRWNGTKAELNAFFGLTDETLPPDTKPLYKAKVVTTPPNRLIVRRTPAGSEVDRIHSGTFVDIWQEVEGWSRIGKDRWVMARWIDKIVEPTLVQVKGLFNVQLWNQRDSKWSNDRMGSSYITLKEEGCLVYTTASLLNFLGIDTDPGRYNSALTKTHGYKPPNLMYWKAPEVLWPNKVARAEYQWFNNGIGWEPFAKKIIQSGRPALAQVDVIPGGPMNQHWVSLLGTLNNIWYCYDPLYGSISALSARYNGVYRIVGYQRR